MKKILISWVVDSQKESDDPSRIVEGSGYEIGDGGRGRGRLIGGFVVVVVVVKEEELVVVILGGG